MHKLQKIIVKNIYADHNKSAAVKKVLSKLLDKGKVGVMLNIGSGDTRIHPDVVNMEVEDGLNVDIIGSADSIPYPDGAIDLVVSQEVLEHVSDPCLVLNEVHRVLRPGGIIYLQVPWVIGYHGCPKDYWRFSKDGIQKLVESHGFHLQDLGMTVGPFTGLYRVVVEAFAIFGSIISAHLYKPFKLLSAIVFLPVKWLDVFSGNSQEAHRLAGGFFVVATKEIFSVQ